MSRWRPHTTGIVIGGLVLILVALVASYMLRTFQTATEVRLGSGVFSVQLATTDKARKEGLSGVEKLASNGGLLMVFEKDDKWGIWMKDMKIPLDIIWLDKDKKVTYIVTDAQPELGVEKTYTPLEDSRYVLELPTQSVKNAGIRIGSVATFILEGGQ